MVGKDTVLHSAAQYSDLWRCVGVPAFFLLLFRSITGTAIPKPVSVPGFRAILISSDVWVLWPWGRDLKWRVLGYWDWDFYCLHRNAEVFSLSTTLVRQSHAICCFITLDLSRKKLVKQLMTMILTVLLSLSVGYCGISYIFRCKQKWLKGQGYIFA